MPHWLLPYVCRWYYYFRKRTVRKWRDDRKASVWPSHGRINIQSTCLTRLSRLDFIRSLWVCQQPSVYLDAVFRPLKSCEFRSKSEHVEKLICDDLTAVRFFTEVFRQTYKIERFFQCSYDSCTAAVIVIWKRLNIPKDKENKIPQDLLTQVNWYHKISLICHLCNLFPCFTDISFHALLIIIYVFALRYLTPCLFWHKIYLPVHIGLDSIHCTQ